MAVPLPDSEIQPSARENIERGRLLSEQHGIVPRQDHHGSADPQRAGASGYICKHAEGSGDLVPSRKVMLDQESTVISKRLGLDVELDIVAEALPGPGPEIADVRLGAA